MSAIPTSERVVEPIRYSRNSSFQYMNSFSHRAIQVHLGLWIPLSRSPSISRISSSRLPSYFSSLPSSDFSSHHQMKKLWRSGDRVSYGSLSVYSWCRLPSLYGTYSSYVIRMLGSDRCSDGIYGSISSRPSWDSCNSSRVLDFSVWWSTHSSSSWVAEEMKRRQKKEKILSSMPLSDFFSFGCHEHLCRLYTGVLTAKKPTFSGPVAVRSRVRITQGESRSLPLWSTISIPSSPLSAWSSSSMPDGSSSSQEEMKRSSRKQNASFSISSSDYSSSSRVMRYFDSLSWDRYSRYEWEDMEYRIWDVNSQSSWTCFRIFRIFLHHLIHEVHLGSTLGVFQDLPNPVILNVFQNLGTNFPRF